MEKSAQLDQVEYEIKVALKSLLKGDGKTTSMWNHSFELLDFVVNLHLNKDKITIFVLFTPIDNGIE